MVPVNVKKYFAQCKAYMSQGVLAVFAYAFLDMNGSILYALFCM
jgi:hypothetical protein